MAYSNAKLTEIFDRKGGCCFYCGKRLTFSAYGVYSHPRGWEVDHVYPKCQGGSDNWYNLVPACCRCNREKCGKMSLWDNLRRWF